MSMVEISNELFKQFIVAGDPARSDYLTLIKEIMARKQQQDTSW